MKIYNEYRIWSKVIKRWITDLSLENLSDVDITLNDLLNNQKYIIFQQFIGLEDKSKKQIFEGDIVKFHWFGFDGNETDNESIGIIKYNDNIGAFCIALLKNDWYFLISETSHFQEPCIEILGNILENPELLKND